MATALQLDPGALFARDFRVVRRLAEGGMGAVYVVEQLSTGHQRALKVMLPQFVADPKQRERFAQEARVGAQIKSAHVVEVAAAGIDEATLTPWIAMELLEGDDLAAIMHRRGPLPPAEVAEVFDQLADALGKAHAAGIVHRDLKPENIFISRSRLKGVPFVAKVLDFGIAKIVAEQKTAATVTSTIGSPLWMAPEQTHRGAKIRPATDVWPLGLIAYHLLTGRFYWNGANVPDDEFNLSGLLVEIMVTPMDPPSFRAADRAHLLPPGFDVWFSRCVVREPEARFRDAGEALAALLPLLQGPSAHPSAPVFSHGATMPLTAAPLTTTALPSAPQSPYPTAPQPQTHTLASVVPSEAYSVTPPPPSRNLGPWVALAASGVLAASLAAGAFLLRSSQTPQPVTPTTASIANAAPEQHTGVIPPVPDASPTATPPATPTVPPAEPAVAVIPPPPTEPAVVVHHHPPTVPRAVQPAPPPPPPPPTPGATPMDTARACLRNSTAPQMERNQCVIRALAGHVSGCDSALLAASYRDLGQTENAVRAMSQYIRACPTGPLVTNFENYIDEHQR